MLLLIDIFSINRSRGYENPSLDIIVIELCSTGGCPPRRGSWTLLSESKCYFCCYSYIISVLLWRLFWLYCCYSTISSILFMFCILFISGILQVVSEHFPRQKVWVNFFFKVETYSAVIKPQRSVVTRINPWLRDSYTQEIQVVLKRTSVGHPCNPCWYPFEW
jgi:hypothetical protein